ncbi:ABC transporter, ATP-binding protein [Amylolactobacillus amylotrophicus DSM 20534]|uniref:ABC transporter, ATP-binding protein n=3 Tax=Amylolactobacillus TaxID=2767876 RepID=A0A0R1YS85_9LACO|nr:MULTISPECIES: ABC-F family ATP-binding cassette domain-containing protein [Amylolactobacillus]APT18080.1 ABC transporter [Amylolactobacillus amylophilus DSM 20533 = JCM 1125]KRK37426.1 ABC transporter, ATP-binding protein [Amylolactobacillus amylotrophicus DSM 20534]KRM42099.1 ABC transporter, ATP-binding protein [Amylolactobacillus amylophilus DSM 20533 = JCM 1125]GED80560.1 ABC transporter [Amylolactobacillus amylophilus]
MIIMQANNVERSFGATTLFKNISFEIDGKSRIGLVGPNGVGKSTLIKILTGQEAPTSGNIVKSKNITFGYIAQENNLNPDQTVYGEMAEVFAPLIELGHELTRLQQELATTSTPNSEMLEQYDQLQFNFEQQGGFTYQAEIKSVLNGFKFDETTYDKKISVLSGGEKTRLSFVKLLLKSPDLLILDEPTNHLDLDTLDWLESFLKTYKGAILAVSHDQYFLDAVATDILELRHGQLNKFKGNYTAYTKLRTSLDDQQQEAYERQQAEIKKQEDFIQKNIVRASTTKRAQSRQKQLDKLERIEPPKRDQKVRINFKIEQQTGKEVLIFSDVSVGYPNKTMIEDVNLQVRQQDRLAIIGPNGIGKSTLLKTIVKELPLLKGNIKYGANLKIGYYDQEINHLNPKETVLDTIWNRHKTMPEREVRSILASFLFGPDDLEKTVAQLSGGQRARLSLTVLSLEFNNVLIMDEPTNHLDIEAKEVLEKALEHYEGTIVFVSHDRYFINQLAQKIYSVNERHGTIYDGNYSFYLEKRNQLEPSNSSEQDNATTANANQSKVDYQLQKKNQAEKRRLEREVDQLEHQISEIENKITELQLEMAQPEVATDFGKLDPLQRKVQELEQENEAISARWEQALTKLETFAAIK